MAEAPLDTAPAPSEDNDSRYLVESRVEILHVLRWMQQHGEMVSLYFDGGAQFVLTTIVEVDPTTDRLILDTGKDPVANRKLLASPRAFFEGKQDKVRVRFRLDGLSATTQRDRPALAVPLPKSLFKFQRREYYRVALPIARPVLCTIPYDDHRSIEATVLDLSVGGVKLGHYPDETPLKVGMVFTGCALALPDTPPMRVTLEVRNNVSVPMRNGVTARRAGCKFTELPRGAESAIQKFIIRVEREQRALTAER